MLSRREVLAGGLAGSLTGDAVDRGVEPQPDRDGQREIERAIRAVGTSLDRAFNSVSLSVGTVGTLRKNFETFLRSNGKFPDYCDIGIGVFFEIYDWHIRNRQQIAIVRQPDNRYAIQFMFTTLVLRHENDANFVGYPYDRG